MKKHIDFAKIPDYLMLHSSILELLRLETSRHFIFYFTHPLMRNQIFYRQLGKLCKKFCGKSVSHLKHFHVFLMKIHR